MSIAENPGVGDRTRLGWRTPALVLALYAACLVGATYPFVLHVRTQLPSTVDPLQHLWVMRWYKTCLLEGRSPLRCPELQYPVGAPIGNFSPLHLQSLLYLPLSAITTNDILCFNLIWWAGFLFTGMGTFALAWHVVRDRAGAAMAGLLAMLAAPMMVHSHAHLELIHVGGFPVFLLAWLRFVDKPGAGRLSAATAAYVLVALSAAYFAVFAIFPAALYVVVGGLRALRAGGEGWAWTRRRASWGLAFGAVAGLLVLAVFSGHVWARAHGYSLGRPRSEFDRFGAPFWSYLLPTPAHALGGLLPVDAYAATGTVGEGVSYLGIVTLTLLHYAAVRRVGFRRAGYWWAALALLIVLSMGSTLRFGSHAIGLPDAWLWRHLFVFRMIRVPARFNLFVGVAAAVVAAAGVRDLLSRVSRPLVRRVAFAAIATVAVLDLRTGPYDSQPPPSMPGCYLAIKDRDPGATFLEVPQTNSGGAEVLSATAGYWQALHRCPSSTGYCGQPNALFDELLTSNSPFAYFRLGDPGYLHRPEGEFIDLSTGVDFDDLAWLYLATHKFKYVVLHKWATTVGGQAMHPWPLMHHLDAAKVYEDDRTVVYESARLKRPTHPVVLCKEGWRQRVGWRGRMLSTVGREAHVEVYNTDVSRPLTLTLEASSLRHPRIVRLRQDGAELARWEIAPGDPRTFTSPPFQLAAGTTDLTIDSGFESTPKRSREAVAEGDMRPYSLRVVGLAVRPVEPPTAAVAALPGTVQ